MTVPLVQPHRGPSRITTKVMAHAGCLRVRELRAAAGAGDSREHCSRRLRWR